MYHGDTNERQHLKLHMTREEGGKGKMAVNQTSIGNLHIFSWPFLAAGSLVTANSHWSILSLYTDVDGQYPEPPLKLSHRALNDQWHLEMLIKMVYVPWWH